MFNSLVFAATTRSSSSVDSGALVAFFVIYFAFLAVVYVFFSFCLMKIFEKAGLEKWWAWVPFVNTYGLWKLTGREVLWLILLFVPYVNFVAIIVIYMDVAKAFGKSSAYGIGLIFLSFIFLPMLAFGDSTYLGPVHAPPGGPGPGQPPYGQPQYGQPAYGQPYAQPPYGQPQHGQPQYGQPEYGQSPYPPAQPYPPQTQPAPPGWGQGQPPQ